MSKNPNRSFWLNTVNVNTYPSLNRDIKTDALIVGGGLFGITCAYLLSLEGVRTVLIEGNRLFNGVSGNTTAKITSQHGLIYDRLIRKYGEEKAQMYARSNEEAIQFITKTASDHNIHCDLQTLPAYIYTELDSSIEYIEKETIAAQKSGINASLMKNLELPLKIKAAIMFHNQAQFHPVKYMNELAVIFINNGGKIFENTRALSLEQGKYHIVKTSGDNQIKAKHVIIATHFPFYDGLGLYFSRLYAERSYITAVAIKEDFPRGMFLGADDPALSFRSQSASGNKLLLIGGENHKTGDGSSSIMHYANLLRKAKELYTVTSNPYQWSAQDYNTPDNIPYIGELTSGTTNIYVATGFKKWGMTTATLSAIMIRDLIIKGESPWTPLYNPSRFNLKASTVETYIKENFHVAKELIKGKVRKAPEFKSIKEGEAKEIEIEGKKYGGYKDSDGTLYILDITCTHLGCELKWNDAERSWDCPCHGSRFNYDGSIIEGPAHNPLKQKNNEIQPNLK